VLTRASQETLMSSVKNRPKTCRIRLVRGGAESAAFLAFAPPDFVKHGTAEKAEENAVGESKDPDAQSSDREEKADLDSDDDHKKSASAETGSGVALEEERDGDAAEPAKAKESEKTADVEHKHEHSDPKEKNEAAEISANAAEDKADAVVGNKANAVADEQAAPQKISFAGTVIEAFPRGVVARRTLMT
jgi:hypothetical protein